MEVKRTEREMIAGNWPPAHVSKRIQRLLPGTTATACNTFALLANTARGAIATRARQTRLRRGPEYSARTAIRRRSPRETSRARRGACGPEGRPHRRAHHPGSSRREDRLV